MVRLILFSVLFAFVLREGIAKSYDELADEFSAEFKVSEVTVGPGFVVNISKPGAVLMSVEIGAANLEHNIPISRNTVFHIASLSKQITAATLAHAINDGLVNLDDLVSKWLPETKKYGNRLRVEHLLFMTSGLTEYTTLKRTNDQPWATFHYFSNDEAINTSLSVEHLLFEPGEKWQYSNINFMIIAKIVSIAYKKSFSEIVDEKVFQPLGMKSSLINDDITQIIPNRADAYLDRVDGVLNELNMGANIDAKAGDGMVRIHRNSPHYGGSGVMTSMNDWVLWQAEMINQIILGKAFWALMLSTKKFQHPKSNDAFGLVHGNICGESTLWYEGADIDASSYSITFTDSGLNFSCFSNNPLESCRSKIDWLIQHSDMCIAE